MVSSQVHSQHPSHILFPSMGQHRSWAPNKADVHDRELETSMGFWPSNSTPDIHFMSSNGYACPGPVNMTSPLNSSWIQRLIPSQNIRVEQSQPSDKRDRDNYGIDGLQANWNESADHLGNQSDIPVYENSRRSKQDFFSSHKVYRGTKPPGACMGNGVNARCFEAPVALPPEIHVLPKSLPVVESLLPGCSEKARENQIFPEANMPHVLSRCTGFAKPVKQTVHFSADEKSRVSYTSIETLNCRRAVCAAGDLIALKPLQQGKRGAPLQPCSEFSFNSNDAVAPNIDIICSGKDKQRGTNSRTYRNSTQPEGSFATLYNEGRRFDSHMRWNPSVLWGQAVENSLFNGYSTLNSCWNSKKHSSDAHDGSEALYARESFFDEDGWSFQYKEKDEVRQVSNVAKEMAGIYLPHQMIEQDLGSSHEEQGGTSRSFSFHFENQSVPDDLSKVVMRKGQWPFSPSTPSSQNLCQSRRSEDTRATGLANATTLGIPCDKSFSFQDPGLHEAGTNCIGRNQFSPFFGMENPNDSSSCRVFNKHDISPYEAACIDIGGVRRGQLKIEALHATGVDHASQTLKGRHPFSRLESNSMIEGAEGKELMRSFPLFRPSSQRSTPTRPPEGAQSNHADGNRVSGNCWPAHMPLIQGSSYSCPRESTQLKYDGGNPCSIGSCSERPSNPCSEDPSTSVDARSRSLAPEKPVPLQELRHSPPHASIGVNCSSGDQESAGKEATSWEASGLGTKKNVWMERWSTLKSRGVQPVSRPNGEEVALVGMRRARNYSKDLYVSQGIGELSCHFDARPAKRDCREERSGPHYEVGIAVSKSGSVVVVDKNHNYQAPASHFMKHFFSPSMAAMAIMGMTARKVKATQPQKSGLFGSWALNASIKKPSGARAEVCKEFVMTMPSCKLEISQSAATVPPAQADL